MMRTALLAAAFTAQVIAETAAPTTPEQLRAIVRKAIDGLKNEDERRGQFLFKARNERKELDADGKVLSQHSHSWERVEIDGFPFGRTLERDGKPLTGQERKSEDAAIQKRLVELKAPKPIKARVGGLEARGGGKGVSVFRCVRQAIRDEDVDRLLRAGVGGLEGSGYLGCARAAPALRQEQQSAERVVRSDESRHGRTITLTE